jgi:hypothetical protein
MIGYEVEYAYTEESLDRLRTLEVEVGTLEKRLDLAMPEQVELLAHELAAAIEKEFKIHDRTGKDDDPSQWKEDYLHTIDTLEVHCYGLHAVIQMAGGAVFVEYKTDPHIIEAHDDNGSDGLLHFKWGDRWMRIRAVRHPGYKGDPFVERAIADVRLVSALASILDKVHLARWAAGPYSFANEEL